MEDAIKALGKEGDLPEPRPNIVKACDELEDEWDAFDQKRDEFQKVIDDMDDRASKLPAAIKAYRNQIDKGSFGLNQKRPSSPTSEKSRARCGFGPSHLQQHDKSSFSGPDFRVLLHLRRVQQRFPTSGPPT